MTFDQWRDTTPAPIGADVALVQALEKLLANFESQHALLLKLGAPDFVAMRDQARAALSPAAQPPAGWRMVPDASSMTDEQAEAIAALANCCGGIAYDIYRAALAAAPKAEPVQQPERVPLTDDEIGQCLPLGIAAYSTLVGVDEIRAFVRAIEQFHGIKPAKEQAND